MDLWIQFLNYRKIGQFLGMDLLPLPTIFHKKQNCDNPQAQGDEQVFYIRYVQKLFHSVAKTRPGFLDKSLIVKLILIDKSTQLQSMLTVFTEPCELILSIMPLWNPQNILHFAQNCKTTLILNVKMKIQRYFDFLIVSDYFEFYCVSMLTYKLVRDKRNTDQK